MDIFITISLSPLSIFKKCQTLKDLMDIFNLQCKRFHLLNNELTILNFEKYRIFEKKKFDM